METTLKYLFFKHMNNGFLYGPWIPIYGLGSCIIIFIMRLIFNRVKTTRIKKIIIFAIISTLSLTLLEFIGGHLIELITGKVFWDYSKMKYNIGHYISLEISFIWLIMSLTIIYIIKPNIDKIIKKIPSKLTYLVSLFYLIDIIFTIYNKIK